MINNMVNYEKYVSSGRKKFISYNAYLRPAPHTPQCSMERVDKVFEAAEIYTEERIQNN